MIAFLTILMFPMIMGMGFAGSFYLLTLLYPQRASAMLARRGGLIYLGLLLIPVVVTLVQIGLDGTAARSGLRWPAAMFDPLLSLLISVIGAALLGALLFYNELLLSVAVRTLLTRKHPQLSPLIDGAARTPAADSPGLWSYMGQSLLICFGEELLWRGFMITFLVSRWQWSWLGALLISSALFGLNHYYYGVRNVVLKTISGFVWGWLFIMTGSLLAPFLSHLTFQYFVWRRLQRQARLVRRAA